MRENGLGKAQVSANWKWTWRWDVSDGGGKMNQKWCKKRQTGARRGRLCCISGHGVWRYPESRSRIATCGWRRGQAEGWDVKYRLKGEESLTFHSFLRPGEFLLLALAGYLEVDAAPFCSARFPVAPLASLGYTCREFWLRASYARREFASYWHVSGWERSLTVAKNYVQGEPTFQQKVNLADIPVYSMVVCLNADFQ